MAMLHGSSSIVLPSPSLPPPSSSNPSSIVSTSSPFVVGFSGASLQLSARKSWAIGSQKTSFKLPPPFPTEKKEKREKKEKPPHIPVDKRWMVEESEVDGPDIWNTTWYPKAADHVNTEKPWFIVDATDKILGRLASTIAIQIRGKNLGTFTPSVDMGAFVIVVNAEKVAVSGKKRTQKLYRRHSGRPGGMTVETFDQLQQRIPERIIEHAVRGMLPKGRLGRALFNHLKVYKGPDHPHEAQMPKELPIRDKRIQKQA
ncbi:50S ribosomal protein L13, chloroplastic [Linum grandiflorum]